MFIVNLQKSKLYYFHWLHFLLNGVIVITWIGYHFRDIKKYVWDVVLVCIVVIELMYLHYLSKPKAYKLIKAIEIPKLQEENTKTTNTIFLKF